MCDPLQLTLAKDTTKCCVKGHGAKGDIQPGAQVVFELPQDRRYVPQVLPTRPYLHVPTQTADGPVGRWQSLKIVDGSRSDGTRAFSFNKE